MNNRSQGARVLRQVSPDKPRKSPLRIDTMPAPGVTSPPPIHAVPAPRAKPSAEDLRTLMLGEFCEWLRTRTNQHHRPYQEETISAYREAGAALSAWMTRIGMEADFTGVDTKALNRFFRWYYDNHDQGGTNTKQ
jgi:hypothetical protein